MKRVIGRNIDLNKDVPATVEEMKDGEMRMTDAGIVARVSDQVLQKEWMKAILYDDFEDNIVDPAWNGIWTDKAGGSHAESGGFMAITTNQGGSGGRYSLDQNGILGAGDPIAIRGDFYFDVWGKIVAPFTPDTDGYYAGIEFNFWLISVAKDFVRIRLQSVAAGTQYQPYFLWSNGVSSTSWNGASIAFGAGVNELWWRFRYLPGDSRVRMFCHHGPENPFDSPYDTGWTEPAMSKYFPVPDGNDELRIRLYNYNLSTDTDEIAYYNELARWEELTTTTSTTTTTTT